MCYSGGSIDDVSVLLGFVIPDIKCSTCARSGSFLAQRGLITECQKSVTLKMTDTPLKATSSDWGSSKLPATPSTPCDAGETALTEDVSRVTAQSAYGDGDKERKCATTEPPWLPVAPRTTRRGFPEDMMLCQREDGW